MNSGDGQSAENHGGSKNRPSDARPETRAAAGAPQHRPAEDPLAASFGTLSVQGTAFRRRCDSMTAPEDGDQNESKVLVIYTGGTIGMIRNHDDSTCAVCSKQYF